MSTFQPGMANTTTPLFEPDTSVVTVSPTSPSLSFPDQIPIYPSELTYHIKDIFTGESIFPIFSYLVTVELTVITEDVASLQNMLSVRISGSDASTDRQLIVQYPTLPWINTQIQPWLLTTSGLVQTLSTEPLDLYISVAKETDTTKYYIDRSPVIRYKRIM
jgi:hypothetical protein